MCTKLIFSIRSRLSYVSMIVRHVYLGVYYTHIPEAETKCIFLLSDFIHTNDEKTVKSN